MELVKNKNSNIKEINIFKILHVIWKKKVLIICITVSSAILSILIALNTPNIYSSSALLAPSNDSYSSLSSQLNEYQSLIGLSGGSLTDTNNITQEAIARISSFEFFSLHVFPKVKLENLFAVKKWHPIDNIIIYDDTIFNSEKNIWTRKVNYPFKPIPSEQEAYRIFLKQLSVSEEKKTGFVTITINHKSPHIAEKWAKIIVKNINESMREKDKLEFANSIEFLNEQNSNNKIEEIRDVLSDLLSNQTQKLMLAHAKEGYVFNVIDAPIIPQYRSSPNRALICIIGTIFGGFLSVLLALIISYREENN